MVVSCLFQDVSAQSSGNGAQAAALDAGSLSGIDMSYDSFEYIGQNLIVKGHVVIHWMNMQITADSASVNLDTNDIEAVGNVTFISRVTQEQTVSLDEYQKLVQDPYQMVELVKYQFTPTGQMHVLVKITYNHIVLKTDRASLNLNNGTVQIKDFIGKFGASYVSGKKAERTFDGKFSLYDSKVTTCNYLLDHHDHYAVFSRKAVLSPREANRGILNYNADHGDHSILAYNSFLEIYGIPVFWFPILYKPMDVSTFGGLIEFGSTSSWGQYIRTSKNFQIMDDPYLNVNLMLDYYSRRGIGYGINTDLITAESSTELFFYGINDRNPYRYFDRDYNEAIHDKWYRANSRLALHEYRYEFKFANLTHITPRLDFRAQVDVISDFNFLRDYFNERYSQSVEPPTYASLEYQMERMTASLYSTVRVNDFFTTVERMPQLMAGFPRQELFGGLYYQGETSFDYLEMDWRHFDYPSIRNFDTSLRDYHSARLDSLHMFYYPLKWKNINFIPRAGFRLTAYSNSSKTPVSYSDLTAMFLDNTITGQPEYEIVNHYDNRGGSKFRVAGEVGMEINTKFYKTWQNVRNAYWELDGLRHVMVPYINYTYIPSPTVNREYLYYFDDIDRIDEQNFVRLGAVNRIQTRRNNQIQEIFSIETFWDYFFYRESDFNHIGDLGVILHFSPMSKLTFNTSALFDLGQCDSDHKYGPTRNGRFAGRPGLKWKYINRLYSDVQYAFAPGWRAYAAYQYSDLYNQRSAYSMGSSLTQIS